MLRVTDNFDPLLARPFGISSVLTKTTIELLYRVAGRGTFLLSRMKPGHSLEMLGPLGNGFPLPEKGMDPVLVTGGSGFPPLHFLARTLRKLRYHTVACVGARGRKDLPPDHVLRSFTVNTAAVHIATEDGSTGKKGIVTDLLSHQLAGIKSTARPMIFACGPVAMLEAVSRIAEDHSVPCYVSVEERMACGVGACMGCSVGMKTGGYRRACKEGPVFDAREIAWSSPSG